jgi:hypothetical protein
MAKSWSGWNRSASSSIALRVPTDCCRERGGSPLFARFLAFCRHQQRETRLSQSTPEPSAIRNVWSAALSQAKNESDRMACANVFGLGWS